MNAPLDANAADAFFHKVNSLLRHKNGTANEWLDNTLRGWAVKKKSSKRQETVTKNDPCWRKSHESRKKPPRIIFTKWRIYPAIIVKKELCRIFRRRKKLEIRDLPPAAPQNVCFILLLLRPARKQH